MLVAKHQVIPEGPWTGKERCSHPTRSSQDELDFFKRGKQTFYCIRTLVKENLIVWNDDKIGYSYFAVSQG